MARIAEFNPLCFRALMGEPSKSDQFIAAWRHTGGSELANTQSFINGLCQLIGVDAPAGSRTDDTHNDYVFERRVFQDNGDGTNSFGRMTATKAIASFWRLNKAARATGPQQSAARPISISSDRLPQLA